MYLIYPYDGLDRQNSYQYFQKEDANELHLNVLFFDISQTKYILDEFEPENKALANPKACYDFYRKLERLTCYTPDKT